VNIYDRDTHAFIRELPRQGRSSLATDLEINADGSVDIYYRQADFTLALTREVWAKLYLNQATVGQLAEAGALKVKGDAAACDRVLELFDPF
jgi:ubiquinone biosynthesis protein UbiJ